LERIEAKLDLILAVLLDDEDQPDLTELEDDSVGVAAQGLESL